MLKFIFLIFCIDLSVARADIKFDELIKKNIEEENVIAAEAQQFAGFEPGITRKTTTEYTATKIKKEPDFKVVLRKKSTKKNPAVQRSIASKKNRVTKKIKKKKTN